MMTRYRITTAAGTTHTGLVQGSGGRMKGEDGLRRLRHAAQGRPVNVYDPTSRPPYQSGSQGITHVAVYQRDVDRDFAAVAIRGATIEIA